MAGIIVITYLEGAEVSYLYLLQSDFQRHPEQAAGELKTIEGCKIVDVDYIEA